MQAFLFHRFCAQQPGIRCSYFAAFFADRGTHISSSAQCSTVGTLLPRPRSSVACCGLIWILFSFGAAFGDEYLTIAGRNGTSLQYCRLDSNRCFRPNDIDFGGVRDLAIDPLNPGMFWAATRASRTDGDIELLQVNPGSNELPTKYSLSTDEQIVGLAIDPADGQFYGIRMSELVRLDPNTGSVESVGPLNVEVTQTRAPLDFDAEGALFGYLAGDLMRIDTVTGNATTVASVQNAGLYGLAFHPETNALHGVGHGGRGVGYQYFDIDPVSGNATVSGPSIARQAGLVFVKPNLDCNENGTVGLADLNCQSVVNVGSFLEKFNLIVGDFDASGEVGFADFLILSSNYGRSTRSYADGDADLSGGVFFDDFLVLSAAFGKSSPVSAKSVPEPYGAGILSLAMLCLCSYARRRRTYEEKNCLTNG